MEPTKSLIATRHMSPVSHKNIHRSAETSRKILLKTSEITNTSSVLFWSWSGADANYQTANPNVTWIHLRGPSSYQWVSDSNRPSLTGKQLSATSSRLRDLLPAHEIRDHWHNIRFEAIVSLYKHVNKHLTVFWVVFRNTTSSILPSKNDLLGSFQLEVGLKRLIPYIVKIIFPPRRRGWELHISFFADISTDSQWYRVKSIE